MSSLIILNFNGKDYLHKCLESVPHLPGMEKILIDNASMDDSWQIADKYNFKVIHADNKHQFITGINKAISVAKPGVFIFSQADVIFKGMSIVELEIAAQKNPDAFIQPVFLKPLPKGNEIDNAGMNWIWPGYGIGVTSRKNGIYPTGIVTSITFATHSKNLDKLGYYDTCFAPAYYEDCDMALRAKKLGIRQLVNGNAFVTHLHNKSFSKSYSKLAISDICRKNRRYVVRKHYKGLNLWARITALNILDSIKRWIQLIHANQS